MAVISFPAGVVSSDASPMVRRFGGVLTPFLGGPEQNIKRLGTRFGIRIVLPAQRTRDQALIIQSRLVQALDNDLLFKWPQPGFNTGNPGAPLVASTATGMAVALKDVTVGYLVREGQFLSFIHGGRRYLHMVTADAIVGGGGTVAIAIWPMLRVVLSANDVVEIAEPKIEGLVNKGEETSWQMSVQKLAAFSFTLSESA